MSIPLQLTLGNHLRIGFGPRFAAFDPSQSFCVYFGKLSRFPLTPFEEACFCARDIARRHSNLRLCLSGGLDSEAMALAFLAERVSFEVRILRFKGGWNHDDVQHAIAFCEKHRIPYQTVQLDIFDFLESGEYLDWARDYHTCSPELAAHCWFLDQIDGTPVLAGEVLRMEIIAGVPGLPLTGYRNFAVYRYFERSGREGVPCFHYYSSEFAWSFMAHVKPHPEIYEVELDDRSFEYYRRRERRYIQGGFPIAHNPKRVSKLHGFERIKLHYDAIAGHSRGYSDRFRYPVEVDFPDTLEKSILVDQGDGIAQELLKPAWPRYRPGNEALSRTLRLVSDMPRERPLA